MKSFRSSGGKQAQQAGVPGTAPPLSLTPSLSSVFPHPAPSRALAPLPSPAFSQAGLSALGRPYPKRAFILLLFY